MSSHAVLRSLLPLLCLSELSACTQPSLDVTQAIADAAPASSMPARHETGSVGPDAGEALLAPDQYHGNWRLIAADDPHHHAMMALTLQSSAGAVQGSGDYLLHQPFCDALDGRPITGTTDCELIGQSAAFDRVQVAPERIVLAFHPTADGTEHRLELRRDGERLVGTYVADANGIRLSVRAERASDAGR